MSNLKARKRSAAPLCVGVILLSMVSISFSQEARLGDVMDVSKTPKKQASSKPEPAKVSAPQESDKLSQLLQSEMSRRQTLVADCQRAVKDGQLLYSAGDFAAAADRFRFVIGNLPKSPQTRKIYEESVIGLVNSDTKLAEKAMADKRYEQAGSHAAEALGYMPENTKLKEIVSQVDKQIKPNTTIPLHAHTPEGTPEVMTPDFMQRIEKVNELVFEGDSLRDTGQYLKAEDRYNQVLLHDPYNETARERLKRLSDLKLKYYKDAKQHTRQEMLYEVTKAWSNPATPKKDAKSGVDAETSTSITRVAQMEERLNSIVVDRVSFEDSTVEEAVQFLRLKSRETDSGGINFVLKSATTPAAAPATGTATAAPAVAAPAPTAARKVTVTATNVTLASLLELIVKQAGYIYQVQEYAVLVAPETENLDVLYTREYQVPAGFFGTLKGGDAAGMRDAVKKKLESNGVKFEGNASASFLPSNNKLVVRNTIGNLNLVQSIINADSKTIPQVLVETRFMEVNQSDLDELSFRWNINRQNRHILDPDVGTTQRTLTDTPGIRSSAPNTGQANPPYGDFQLPREMAVGNGGLTANGLDTLLNAAAAGFGPIGQTMQNAFRLTGVDFEMLIYALSQKTGTDLMAAPKVVTKSGQQAEIKIIRDFMYPDPNSITPPTVDPNISQLPGGGQYRLVTPSTPSTFKSETVGVILTVNPSVFQDNQLIDLKLTPLVREFEGFINYGSPINAVDLNSGQSVKQTDNFINTPVFSVRQMSTSVTVPDKQTVMLGGMIREDRQVINDKIPGLGDVPMLGRLFRSKVEQTIKKNLLIFVTCTIVKPDGSLWNPINLEDSQNFNNWPKFTNVRRVQPALPPSPKFSPREELRLEDSKGALKGK